MNTTPYVAPEGTREGERYGQITPRAVGMGIVACCVASMWLPFSEFIVGASRLHLSQLPVGAMAMFFALLLANALVGRISRRLMLSPSEVLVIFVMVWIATLVATANLLNWTIGAMAIPYYMATPENRWMDDLWPHLRQWAVVQGPREELRWAYVGKPEGVSVPWRIWLIPSFWWGSFVGAIALASVSLASLLRRQWAEHERLPFPLAQVPLDIIANPGGRWNLPEVVRTRGFWVGAGIPLFLISYNALNYFSPLFPRIPVMQEFSLSLIQGAPNLYIKVNLYVIGFAYMVNTNTLFSVWFWYVLVLIESIVFARIGYTLGKEDVYSSRDAITSWQGFGGLIVFVVFGLWMARHHLRHVWHVVVRKAAPDDERELLPYRWAIIGLFAAALYAGSFLVHLGMCWRMVFVWYFGMFVACVGTSRVIAQTGLVYMQTPLNETMFTFGAFGTVRVPASQIVGMVGPYSLTVNGRTPLMPGILHIGYIGAKIGGTARRMFTTIVIGLIVAYLAGSAYSIYISYAHGVTTFHSPSFVTHGGSTYALLIERMQARVGVDPGKWMFLGIGAVVMSVLTFLQYRFPGWPIHPIGFPIAAADNTHYMFISIIIAWLIKSIILKLGGVQAYERGRPVFLGFIAGYALGIAESFVIDWIWFPGAGHQIHGW